MSHTPFEGSTDKELEYSRILDFIRKTRGAGASKIEIVGLLSVEFPPLVSEAPPEAPAEETEAEAKQRKEALLYGSSA
jgi:hypothetical protein